MSSSDTLAEVEILIVTALPKEYAAAVAIFGPKRKPVPLPIAGHSTFQCESVRIRPKTGRSFKAAIVVLPDTGNNIAAAFTSAIESNFPRLRATVMCGIAGGLREDPGDGAAVDLERDVRLGDVVISNEMGVVQYDLGQDKDGVWTTRNRPRPPSSELLHALRVLEADRLGGAKIWEKYISAAANMIEGALRPQDNTDAKGDLISYCRDPNRRSGVPRLFNSPIASANTLLKNQRRATELRQAHKVLATEMEGAGIADAAWLSNRGYFLVRGICDYGNVKKGDHWQGYAAVAAAAVTRALLERLPVSEPPDRPYPNSQRGLEDRLTSSKKADPELGIARIFRGRTRAFCEEYLVSETGPVPFGGRQSELRRLAAWLEAPDAASRLLLTSPAGRGKSALIVEWLRILDCARGAPGEKWQVAFMPISIRIGTNRPSVFYEGIARRLAEILGDSTLLFDIADPDAFRYLVRELLEKLCERKKRILLVVDGLDEALRGGFDPAVIPVNLPSQLRVLVTARLQVGDTDSRGWLARLGWDRGVKVDTFTLDRLDGAGIADVLVKLGAPIDILARDRAIVDRLGILTEGEPLLVRYYAEDLWELVKSGARITRSDLDSLNPGFDSYFERWFQHQADVWRLESSEVDIHDVDWILSILAFSLGPLEQSDLLAIFNIVHRPTIASLDRLLSPLRRFVIGDGNPGTGYVLSHPKIAEYLRAKRFTTRSDLLRQGFASWGLHHVRAINTGNLRTEEASHYALQFISQHFLDAGWPPTRSMVLVDDGWRRAWEHLEGGPGGFATDIRTVWKLLQADRDGQSIAAQWRCTLALSSIGSLGYSMPGVLLLRAADCGVLSIRQAQHLAGLIASTQDSAETFAQLAVRAHSTRSLCEDLIVRAVERASTAITQGHRAEILSVLTTILLAPDSPIRAESLASAVSPLYDAASQIADPWALALALVEVAPFLPTSEVEESVVRILRDSHAKPENTWRPRVMGALSRYVAAAIETTQRTDEICATALSRAKQSRKDELDVGLATYRNLEAQAGLLSAFRFGLSAEAFEKLSSETLRDYNGMGTEFGHLKHRAIISLLPCLAPEHSRAIATAALKMVSDGKADSESIKLLSTLVSYVPRGAGDLLDHPKWLAIDIEARMELIAAVAPVLSGSRLETITSAALADAIKTRNVRKRLAALVRLAPHLTERNMAAAIDAALGFQKHDDRATALAAVCAGAPEPLIERAYRAVLRVRDKSARIKCLVALWPVLAERDKVLQSSAIFDESTGSINEECDRLKAIAPYLRGDQIPAAVREAIKYITEEGEFGDTYGLPAFEALVPRLSQPAVEELLSVIVSRGMRGRLLILRALSPHLPSSLIPTALRVGRSIRDSDERSTAEAGLYLSLGDAECRAGLVAMVRAASADPPNLLGLNALCLIAPHLPAEAMAHALELVRRYIIEHERGFAFEALAPHLPATLIADTFPIVDSISDPMVRARAFCALVPLLPQELMRDAIRVAWPNGQDFDRGALTALVPHLPDNLLPEAFRIAMGIRRYDLPPENDQPTKRSPRSRRSRSKFAATMSRALYGLCEGARFSIFSAMGSRLDPKTFDGVLEMAMTLTDATSRIKALSKLSLIPGFPNQEELLRNVYFSALTLEENESREILRDIAGKLPHELIQDAYSKALALTSEWHRAQHCALLIPYITARQRIELIDVIEDLQGRGEKLFVARELISHMPEHDRVRLVAIVLGEVSAIVRQAYYKSSADGDRLAGHLEWLPTEMLGAVLDAAENAGKDLQWSKVISRIADRLPEHLMRRTFRIVANISDEDERLRCLALIARYIPVDLEPELIFTHMTTAADVRRDQVFKALSMIAPNLARFGGDQAMLSIIKSVAEVTTWYS